MATKKLIPENTEAVEVTAHVETENQIAQAQTPDYFEDDQFNRFAEAALKSLDWNQIGMGVDQAAKLCWSMAEAMVRNKP